MLPRLFFLFLIAHVRIASAQTTNLPITAYMDGGTSSFDTKNVWYERGLNTIKPHTGLPPAGIPFQSQSHSNHWYVLASYTNLNTILLPSSTNFTAEFSLSSPEAFSELSFLVSASWGGVNLNVIVHHQDETSQTNTFRVDDWANSTNHAWIAGGRFDMRTRRFEAGDTNQWRLSVRQIALTNNLSPVTRIEFSRGPIRFGERVAIFGVSGSLGADFTPISVSGFNEDIVIEATYTGYSLPNLRASIAGVSEINDVGGLVSAFLTVRNDGNTVSPPAKVGIYLRRNNEPYDTAPKLAEIDVPPVEPTGNPHVVPISLNTPPGVGGQFSLSHWIDPDSQIPELTETDNQGSTPIGIGPNLNNNFAVLTNISPWEVVINVTIRNGGAAATPSRAAVYLATTGGRQATNGLKVAEFDVPALGVFPDGTWSHARTLNVPIPSQFTAGSYYLVVQVDSTYQLPEVDESNNLFSVSIQIPNRPVVPDLRPIVSGFTLLTNTNPWEVEMNLIIRNEGAPAATNRAAIHLSTVEPNAFDGFQLAEFDVPTLPNAASTSFPWQHALTVKVPLPSGISPGWYYVVVRVDSEHELPEISEDNNSSAAGIQVPNRPASVHMISEVVVDEDSGPIRIPFRIDGFNLSTVVATLSHPPAEHLFSGATFEGNGADRTLAIPLETNLNGNFSAEILIRDGTFEVGKGFSISVRPVNDSFTVELIEDRIIATESQIAIPLRIEDPDGPPIDLQRAVFSDQPNLFSVGGLFFNEMNGALQLVVMTTNRVGASQITVTLGDGDTTEERTFSATIAPPGLQLNSRTNFAEMEITAAFRNPAMLEISIDLGEWDLLQSIPAGHGIKLKRPRVNAEFFRIVPVD